MNDEVNKQLEDWARSVVDLLEDTARASLSSGGLNPKYTKPPKTEKERERREEEKNQIEEEIKELNEALEKLRPAFDELTKWFIDPMREISPDKVGYGYEKLCELMVAADLIGSRGTITAGLSKHVRSISAKPAGNESVKKRKPVTDAKHTEVLRLRREIEKRRIKSKEVALSEPALVRTIASRLPEEMKLGQRQVRNILRKRAHGCEMPPPPPKPPRFEATEGGALHVFSTEEERQTWIDDALKWSDGTIVERWERKAV